MSELRTKDLGFAVAVHAAGRLPLVGIETTSPTQCEFVFADDEGVSDILRLDHEKGRFYIPSNQFLPSLRFLRKKMDQALGKRTTKGRNLSDEDHQSQ